MQEVAFSTSMAIGPLLYSAAGQAGGTGYIALMGLAGFAPPVIKPTALALNILVAAISCFRFHRTGMLSWRTCYPFAILGLPFSLVGGALHLPSEIYQPVVGSLLLIAGVQMLRSAKGAAVTDQAAQQVPPFRGALLLGGTIGLISGTTGLGGGIFLAPTIMALGWPTRTAQPLFLRFSTL